MGLKFAHLSLFDTQFLSLLKFNTEACEFFNSDVSTPFSFLFFSLPDHVSGQFYPDALSPHPSLAAPPRAGGENSPRRPRLCDQGVRASHPALRPERAVAEPLRVSVAERRLTAQARQVCSAVRRAPPTLQCLPEQKARRDDSLVDLYIEGRRPLLSQGCRVRVFLRSDAAPEMANHGRISGGAWAARGARKEPEGNVYA